VRPRLLTPKYPCGWSLLCGIRASRHPIGRVDRIICAAQCLLADIAAGAWVIIFHDTFDFAKRPMSANAELPESGMELHDLLNDVEFSQRKKGDRQLDREILAIRRLGRAFATNPDDILQELVDIAVEFCGANSAGISLEETAGTQQFRWVAIAGSFSHFLNGTTPRFFSPCGTAIDRNAPQLYRVTKPYYDYLGIEALPITDGILIPWIVDETRGTIWCVSHRSREAFDLGDYRLLSCLADFASLVLRYQSTDKVHRQEEQQRAYAVIVNELAHRINNPLQSLENALYLATNDAQDPTHLQQATEQLNHLSLLVKEYLRLIQVQNV
jgi:hypothetical protein